MDILLSSGSFDEQCKDMFFLLYPILLYHLEQLGLKKYGDDMKNKCLKTWQMFLQHLPKVKANFQMIKNNFNAF